MKTFRDYLAESVKEYNYRVKSIVPMDDVFLSIVEDVLRKYDLVDITGPKKTITQKNPLDFKNVGYADVYILDITTRIPASSYMMMQELRSALNINENMIVVRGANEPIELETQAIQAKMELNTEAFEDHLEGLPLLGTKEYPEAVEPDKNLYGQVYNDKFLNYLANVKHARPDMTVEPATETKPAKFAWLKGGEEVKAQDPAETAPHGNFDDQKKVFKKAYRNKAQDIVALERKPKK